MSAKPERGHQNDSSSKGASTNGDSGASPSNGNMKKKITLYVDKDVWKEFQKLAIDEEKEYSEMAETAFTALTERFRQDR